MIEKINRFEIIQNAILHHNGTIEITQYKGAHYDNRAPAFLWASLKFKPNNSEFCFVQEGGNMFEDLILRIEEETKSILEAKK